MMAEAAFLAASADEPPEENFIRKHALAYHASTTAAISKPHHCACSPTPTVPMAPTSTS